MEAAFPLEITEYGLLPDTGGPGKFRGGLAIVREYRFTEREGVLQIRSDRHRSRPYGLEGGQPGATSTNSLNPGAEEQVLPAKTLLTMKSGDVLRHTLAGAGGFGPPFERDPEAVLADVKNEKVSVESALEDYGVVIDPTTWKIDGKRTRRLRGE